MGPLSSSLHQRLPATPASVTAARHSVASFAADLQVDLDDIRLAVSEAVANAVMHAYADTARGEIELSAGTSPSALTVTVRDHGRGLRAGGSGSGAGYGLAIIRRIAEHVELSDGPDGVSLTMTFPRAAAPSMP